MLDAVHRLSRAAPTSGLAGLLAPTGTHVHGGGATIDPSAAAAAGAADRPASHAGRRRTREA